MISAISLRESVTKYCAKIGVDPLLVQGAGGNVSWKEGDTLWVKASGTWLADAKKINIFVPVNLSELLAESKEGNFAVVPTVKSEAKLKPSIETLLHALMPHRVVVHVHAIEALAFLVRENAVNELNEKLGSLIQWAIVDYKKPGEELAKAVAKVLVKSQDTQILLLQNHGVVIGGDDIAEVDSQLDQLLSKLKARYIDNVCSTAMLEPTSIGSNQEYLPVDIPGIHILATDSHLLNRVKHDWALYPDHVVFLGNRAACFNSDQELNEYLKKNSAEELLFIKGLGVFAKKAFSIVKHAQLKCYFDVIVRQTKHTTLKVLSEQDIAQLLNWEAEKYRQKSQQ